MAKVFVSHSSADAALSERVRRWLVDAGHDVFLDQNPQDGITPGQEWEERLYNRLRWADAVVCVLTRAYCRSAWCTAEVVIARSQGALLLPVLAEPGVRHELLLPLQAVDLGKGETDARERLDAELREIDIAGGAGWPDDKSPYPGLHPLDADRHRAFFGRDAEIRELTSLLRVPVSRSPTEVLVIVGPSGCGKSSLVRAGLQPAVAREPDALTVRPCRPGPDPVGAVLLEVEAATRKLGQPGRSIADIRRLVRDGGLSDLANDLLLAAPGRRRTRLLLIVDQLEEVLTQADPAARADFARMVIPALGRPLQVVATLRPEFLDALLSSDELADLPTRIHTITRLRRESLVDAVERPAQLVGMTLEDGLADRLVTDTGTGDALPLLAYTLEQLADGAASDGTYRGSRLTLTRYEQMGGVRGALTRHADRALEDAEQAGGRDRRAVIRELLRLVVVDEQGRPVRWRVPWRNLSAPAAGELEAFLEQRLLTTDRDPVTGDATVEVAHEAFLTAWRPLDEAIRAESTALRAHRSVRQATADWVAHGRGTGGLWEGTQLAGVVADLGARTRRSRSGRRLDLETDRIELDPDAREFLLESVVRDRRRRRRGVAVLSALLVLALVGGVVALFAARAATAAQRQAVARQLLTQADAARPTDTRTALRLGLAANQVAPSPAATSNLVDTLSHTHYSRTLPHADGVVTTAYSPDGTTLATGDMSGGATVWDLADPQRPARLTTIAVQQSYVYDVAFSPDGRTLATTGVDGTVGLWDMADRTAPRPLGVPLTGHSAEAHAVAFSPDGGALASVGFDGRLILRDVHDVNRPSTVAEVPTGHAGKVFDVAFSRDGRTVATAGEDRTVRLWDVSDPARPVPLGAPLVGASNAVWAVAFVPSGAGVSAVDQAGELVSWAADGSGRMLGAVLRVHAGPAYHLAFSPDGTMLATAGADHAVSLLSTADLGRPTWIGEPLRAHADQVYSVAFSPTGRSLASGSGSADRTVVLWDLDGPPRPGALGALPSMGPGTARAMAVESSGHAIAVGGRDSAVRIWDVADPAAPRSSGPPIPMPTEIRSLATSLDGRLLAAGLADGAVALVAVGEPGPPRAIGVVPAADGAANGVAFAPDGGRLAVAHEGSGLSLWRVSDPARPEPEGGPVVVHTGPVFSVAFSADGRTLATAGAEGAILDWDVSAPGPPRPIPPGLTAGGAPAFAVAFAPDGTLASGGWNGEVDVWDRSNPGAPRRTPVPSTDGGAVYTVGFSGDGATLAGAGAMGSVTLWDLSVPAGPRALGPPVPTAGSAITTLGFARDRSLLATASTDWTVRLWDISVLDDLRAHAADRACAVVERGLDAEEWTTVLPGLAYEESCPSNAESR
ncbi:nSTAND1 domain-containing NTPase [Actinomycetospora flava]|uniref:TIR domain-containing protein n=1 Tax=Actinomycetospora flava TaxID=3129232 RepID=A0ABU8M6Q0_9PSEU